MTKGLSEVLKDLIPNYGTQIEHYSSLTNRYYRLKSEAEENNRVYRIGTNDVPIDKVDGNVQEKHHELMEKIRAQGRYKSSQYHLSKSTSEEVISEVSDLIDLCENKITRRERKQLGILGLIVLMILAAIYTAL